MRSVLSSKQVKIAAAISIFLILFGIASIVVVKAAEASLPGEKLYGLKLYKESLAENLIFQEEKKLEYKLGRANERLKEITLITGQILVSSGKTSQKTNLQKTGLVLQAADENTGAKVVNLSIDEMIQQGGLYVSRMETIRQNVRRDLEEARQARDVVKTICLDDKLNQIDVALRLGNERYDALKAAAKRGDRDLASHEFTILSVLKDRADQLGAEAQQCIGKEIGIIGESSVRVEVDNIPEPAPEEIIESFPVDEEKLKALKLAWKKFIEIVGKLPDYLTNQQKADIINTFLQTLTNQENAINNLMPFTPPQELSDLNEALSKVEEISELSLSKITELDPVKGAEARRGLIGKEAELLDGYLGETCENNLIINGLCMKGTTNRNGIYINGYANLTNDLTEKSLNSVPWIQNDDYLEAIRSDQINKSLQKYEDDINQYQDEARDLPNIVEAQADFAAMVFRHWIAYSQLPPSNYVSELVAISKINEEAAIQIIAQKDPAIAAGISETFLDRSLKAMVDVSPKEYLLNDYSNRVAEIDEILSTEIQANDEFIRRGVAHGVILTVMNDYLTSEEQEKIAPLIDSLSEAVKSSVAEIKENDPELYESKISYYQPLSQGLQQGIMQGLSQGLEQGLSQGLQQGINQGLQQGLQAGLQSGIQAGLQSSLQAGLQTGLQAGLQQGVYKSFYESFLEELKRPANESWLGGDSFGGDSFGGDGFGGDYFGSNGFGGDGFSGEGDFGGGSDFEGGDDYSSGSDFTSSSPTPFTVATPSSTPSYEAPAAPTPYNAPTQPPAQSTPAPTTDPGAACVQNGCNWTGSTCQCN